MDPIHRLRFAVVDRSARSTDPLVREIRQAGDLPGTRRREGGPALQRRLSSLVLDGVLSIRTGRRRLSGPAAVAEVFSEFDGASLQPRGRLGRLAMQALGYAAALPPIARSFLAERLYRFHSLPADHRRPGDPAWDRLAGRAWKVRQGRSLPWIFFHRDRRARDRWKLYLSPHPSLLAEVAEIAFPHLARAGATSAKIATGTAVSRPDRFMAYFPDRHSLFAAAAALQPGLAHIPGLGVPFTAALGRTCLLSYGCDPVPSAGGPESWRQRITEVLARSIYLAGTQRCDGIDPIQFALRRLALEGVDPVRFTPDGIELPAG